jgi:hypothetical protein
MKKILRRTGLLLMAAFVIIQFFQTEKNSNPGSEAIANDISTAYPVPADVQHILQTSCYDCHSNNTYYPWYDNIQPVSWWMKNHVDEGKSELNFNEFAAYRIRKQYKKLEEIIEQVKENEMPLYSYTLMHKNATLSQEQQLTISNWAAALRDSIKLKYPADSLAKK